MALPSGYIGENSGSPTTLTTGTRYLSSTAAARRVPQWVTEEILNVSDDVAPVDVMMKHLKGVKNVRQVSYTHMEDDVLPQWVEIDSFTTDGDGTSFVLTTGHGARVRQYDLLTVPRTLEVLQVSSVSTDTIVVVRGYGNSSPTTLLTSEDIEISAPAFPEGSTSPSGISQEPAISTNYCQTAKVAIDISGRDMNAEDYGGDEWLRMLKDAGKKLELQKEKAYLHGYACSSDPTTTAGLDELITTNLTSVGGALSEATFNTFLKTCYRVNQTAKNTILVAGELLLDAIDGFMRDGVRYRPDDEMLGVKVKRVQSVHGDIATVKHGLLTVNADRAGSGYFLNLDNCKAVEFEGRGMQHKENVQTPDADLRKDQLLSDFGFWLRNQRSFGKIYGITG